MKNTILFDSFSDVRERMSYLFVEYKNTHHKRGGGWASAFRRGECARGHLWTRALGVVTAIAGTRPKGSEGYSPRT